MLFRSELWEDSDTSNGDWVLVWIKNGQKFHANAVLNMWVMFAILVVSWLCTRVWIGLIRYALVSGRWVGNPIVFWSKICENAGTTPA